MGAQSEPTAIVPHINELRSAFRAANIPVVFLRTGYNADYSDRRGRDARDRVEQLQGLIRGSWDADILDELTPQPGEKVVDKTRSSGFFRTSLEDTLKEHGVNHLIITGVGTDVCVESTARDAYQLDFAVTTPCSTNMFTIPTSPRSVAAMSAVYPFEFDTLTWCPSSISSASFGG